MPLRIGGKDVNKLSGPVSIYILYPTESYLRSFPKAPILIMFGDAHRSNKNYCTPPQDKEGLKHYKINAHFLKLLSDAVGTNEIIDFYLEGGPFHREVGNGEDMWPEKTPMNDLWQIFNTCYNNPRLRREPDEESGCNQIKNIRWQSSDIRFFGDFIGFEQIIASDTFYDIYYNSRKITKKEDRAKFYVDKFEEEIIQDDFYDNFEKTVLLTQEEFIKLHLTENGLIKKQLDKIQDKQIVSKLIIEFKSYIDKEYDRKYGKHKDIIIESMMLLQEIIKNLAAADRYSEAWHMNRNELIVAYNSDWMPLYAGFMPITFDALPDLYILARSHKIMLKPLINADGTKNKYPLINVLYYGDAHTNRLYDHLIDCNSYHSIEKKNFLIINDNDNDAERYNRCLDFTTDNINLDALIKNLKDFRSKQK